MALGHPDGTTTVEVAGVVLEEEIRLERLVEDLLLLARIDEAAEARCREPVDLDDMLFDQARRLRTTTPLDVDVSGVAAGQVAGDKGQLDKLVRNLVDNAARHARARVSLSLEEGPGGDAPRHGPAAHAIGHRGALQRVELRETGQRRVGERQRVLAIERGRERRWHVRRVCDEGHASP